MTEKFVHMSNARAARENGPDEPSNRVTVGGLVDETSVSLCIYGDGLVPEDISRNLGVAPTHAHRKGELKRSRSPHAPRDAAYRSGAWILKMRGQAPQEPEELTTALLDRLPEDETVWAELAARYELWVSYGLHMNAWNRGFALSPGLVARIARKHAQMNFDIYACLEDEKE